MIDHQDNDSLDILLEIPHKTVLRFKNTISTELDRVSKKRELSTKILLDAELTQDIRSEIVGSGHRHLARKSPKPFKMAKEASIYIPEFSGIRFLYQKVILGHLSSLESLELTWNLNLYQDPDFFDSLCAVLKKLKHLKSLHLNLNNFQGCNEEGLWKLGRALKRLVSLKNLTLDFESSGINDKGITNLSQVFRRCRPLQHVDINFRHCQKIIKGMKDLSEGLSGIARLESLKLDFQWCLKILATSFGILGKNLKEMDTLKKIELDFTGWELRRKGGMEDLFEGLSEMKALEEIVIYFCRCDWINDSRFKAIEQYMEGFPALQNIYLDFSRCRKMTEQGVDELRKILEELPMVQDVEVIF